MILILKENGEFLALFDNKQDAITSLKYSFHRLHSVEVTSEEPSKTHLTIKFESWDGTRHTERYRLHEVFPLKGTQQL